MTSLRRTSLFLGFVVSRFTLKIQYLSHFYWIEGDYVLKVTLFSYATKFWGWLTFKGVLYDCIENEESNKETVLTATSNKDIFFLKAWP